MHQQSRFTTPRERQIRIIYRCSRCSSSSRCRVVRTTLYRIVLSHLGHLNTKGSRQWTSIWIKSHRRLLSLSLSKYLLRWTHRAVKLKRWTKIDAFSNKSSTSRPTLLQVNSRSSSSSLLRYSTSIRWTAWQGLTHLTVSNPSTKNTTISRSQMASQKSISKWVSILTLRSTSCPQCIH